MGWTHYWYRTCELDEAAFAQCVRDCEAVVQHSGVAVAGFDGSGRPVFSADHIVFNGQAPVACEPFEMARVEFDRRGRNEVFGFCKTEGMPYDICVQASLVIMKHRMPNAIRVGSDGDRGDWQRAIRLVQDVLGYGDEFCLTEEKT